MIRTIRAVVFASLFPGTLDLIIDFGEGHVNGGHLIRLNRSVVPKNCRMPNTLVWITFHDKKVLELKKMTEDERKEYQLLT